MVEDYRVYALSKKQRLAFYAITALISGSMAYLFYNNIVVSLFFCCLAYPASVYYAGYLAERRKRELTYQFRDLLYALSSSFSAGRQMQSALAEAEGSMKLIYGEKAYISQELAYMLMRMQESKETEEIVLRDFAMRSRIADIVSFSDIYSISKRAGGNMEKIIRKSVAIILDRIELEREIHMLIAQKRMEFIILTVMPLIMLIFLRLTSGSYIAIMYETVTGRVLMTAAFFVMVLAAVLGIRITEISL